MKPCDPLIDVDGRRFPSGASVVVPGAAASAVLPAARYVRDRPAVPRHMSMTGG
jgi:hypothetical protein